MIIFIFLGILLVVGLFLMKSSNYITESWGMGFAGMGGIILLILLIILPINRMEINARIQEFRATKATYETARTKAGGGNIGHIESVALQLDVVKTNRWLANTQYWNSTIFDVWIPDEVGNLKALE